jgi:hypothetical protein
MATTSVHCPVLRAHVTRVTDFEGNPVTIMCAEYEKPTGICRLKRTSLDGGPLSQLLERVEEGTLDRRASRCDLA